MFGISRKRWVMMLACIGVILGVARVPGASAVTQVGGTSTSGCVTGSHTLWRGSAVGLARIEIRYRLVIAAHDPLTVVAGRWQSSAGDVQPQAWWVGSGTEAVTRWLTTSSSPTLAVNFTTGNNLTMEYVTFQPGTYGGCYTIDNVVVTKYQVTDAGTGGGTGGIATPTPAPSGSVAPSSPPLPTPIPGATPGPSNWCEIVDGETVCLPEPPSGWCYGDAAFDPTAPGDALVECDPPPSASPSPTPVVACSGSLSGYYAGPWGDGGSASSGSSTGGTCHLQAYTTYLLTFDWTTHNSASALHRMTAVVDDAKTAWNDYAPQDGLRDTGWSGVGQLLAKEGGCPSMSGGPGVTRNCAGTVRIATNGYDQDSKVRVSDNFYEGGYFTYTYTLQEYADADPSPSPTASPTASAPPGGTMPPGWGTPGPDPGNEANGASGVDICVEHEGILACATPFPVGSPDAEGALDAFSALASHAAEKAPFGYVAQVADALTTAIGDAEGASSDYCFTLPRWTPEGTANTEACVPLQDMANQAAFVRPILSTLLLLGVGVGLFKWLTRATPGG